MESRNIVDFDFIDSVRGRLGTIVCTSGGYDPIHPGHLSCIAASCPYGNTLIVIVNGDNFLIKKKGRPFQNLITRCQIVSYIRGVDMVVPFEIENDITVTEALRRIRPHFFTKGGDRCSPESIPEWATCYDLGINVVTGLGWEKNWSSSGFLNEWERFRFSGDHK